MEAESEAILNPTDFYGYDGMGFVPPSAFEYEAAEWGAPYAYGPAFF